MIKKIILGLLVLIVAGALLVWIKPSQYEAHYFNNGEGKISYKITGAGETVVLLHSFPSDDYMWEMMGFIDLLDDQYQVVTFDARGHGDSYTPVGENAYGVSMVDDVSALLDELGVSKAHIVGHSMGGMTALKFSAKYPEKTISVISLGMGWLESSTETTAFFANAKSNTYSESLEQCFVQLAELALSKHEVGEISSPALVIIGNEDRNYAMSNIPRLQSNLRFKTVVAENAYSGPFRSLILVYSDHPFWLFPIIDSGFIRSLSLDFQNR